MRHATRTMTIAAAVVLLAGCAPRSGGTTTEATASEAADTVTIASAETDAGTSLVGPDGLTLYVFTNDTDGTSTCNDDCAAAWPPFEVGTGATLEAGDGVSGELSTTERDDGATQVTYEGMPLYFYASDSEPGDATGEGVGGVWFIASPEGQAGAEPSGEPSAEPSDDDDDGGQPTDYDY
jgi:predicted lipoprotein with Yx(FWY)xxD motif